MFGKNKLAFSHPKSSISSWNGHVFELDKTHKLFREISNLNSFITPTKPAKNQSKNFLWRLFLKIEFFDWKTCFGLQGKKEEKLGCNFNKSFLKTSVINSSLGYMQGSRNLQITLPLFLTLTLNFWRKNHKIRECGRFYCLRRCK